jgi:hypothetical protein
VAEDAPAAGGHRTAARWVGPALVAAAIAALFWRPLALGEAFLPASHARYVAPWSSRSAPESRPAWNPLQYDSVGQFHAWSTFGARTIRSGRLPFWNPHQLCGTPFAANAQSAIYYPPNILRPVLGAARAAGWLAALHLLIAAAMTYLFLTRLGRSPTAATIGALVYALSAWQVSWLHLPTFAATSCWLPAVLVAMHGLRERPGAARCAALMAATAMTLLAGHLQIAFYVLLCAALLFGWLVLDRERPASTRRGFVLAVLCGWVGACAMAAPQLLLSAELSRNSHRTGGATPEGYSAYTAYAVHPSALATLALPDAFGNPSRPDAPYTGFSRGGMYFNFAEGAMYLGLVTLLFGAVALAGLRTRREARLPAMIAAGALLVAIGTPLAGALYFGAPGFAQSGSPGRILVLWAFAGAWLAAIGYDHVAEHRATLRTVLGSVAAVGVLCAASLAAAMAAAASLVGKLPLTPDDIIRQSALAALAVFAVVWPLVYKGSTSRARYLILAVVAVDLLSHGATYNATGKPDLEMARTEAIAAIADGTGHDRVAPLNKGWSFAGPAAVLPPNLAMLYGLRDVQGYDSLLPGQYKRWLADRMGSDPSPPEVGNMVFVRSPNEAVLDACGVRIVASLERLPDAVGEESRHDNIWLYRRRGGRARATATDPSGRSTPVTWIADSPGEVRLAVALPDGGEVRLADQWWPGWRCEVGTGEVTILRSDGIFRSVRVPQGTSEVRFRYEPAGARLGHFMMALAMAFAAGAVAFGCARRAAWGSATPGS